ncbi:MAG TPA: ABC transporter permease [Chthoniobacterales bacterium]|jgi:putative ABC transport system permease protein|nr:ABC transporter permease [Chthoniobacterales bacterium]
MQTLLSDIRYGFRMMAKQPGFAALAILAFALGIGANTAIFSVVNAVLLRPLPYPESENLIIIRERTNTFESGSCSLPNYLDWRAGQRSFTDLALTRRETFNFAVASGDVQPDRINGARVTFNYLTLLGMKPLVGRDFTEADDQPGGAPVVLISDSLWRTRFAKSPKVLGQHVVVDGTKREIIGVLSEEVKFPRLAQIWVPLGELRKEPNVLQRGNHPGFATLGRLKPGVSMKQANADLDMIAAALEKQYPDTNTGRRLHLRQLLEASVGEYRQSLNLLLGAVSCVLLIACANVANLQLARALARTKELAIRAALGASRWSLARQLLTESTLLALFGAAAGILLAIWSLDAIIGLAPQHIPRFKETRIDVMAMLFTAAIALTAGIISGVWPAWKISNTEALSTVLHEAGTRGGSGGMARQRARSALVVTQVALAVVLLAAAGLTLKSFWRAQNAPINFDPDNILLCAIDLSKPGYDKTDEKGRNVWDEDKIRGFYNRLLDRVRVLPGVEAAAVGANIPFDDSEWDSYFHITGTPPAEPGKEPSAEINIVSADYFKAMKMPILRGRAFGPEDVPDMNRSRSVIIDETFAQRYFPGRDPIGLNIDDNQREADNPAEAAKFPPLTVIGVVARTRNEAPGEDNVEKLGFVHMYFSSDQNPASSYRLLVRTTGGDPKALVPMIRREVQAIDPAQPIGAISTMEDNIASSLSTRRLTMILLGSFAGLALLLASIGLYGVMALSVTQRTRELGIRLALGAARADVFRLVLGQGAALIGVGLLAGLVGAFLAGRALNSLLYNVGSLDAVALIGAVFTLSVVAFFACYLPARRATLVDPIEALRTE